MVGAKLTDKVKRNSTVRETVSPHRHRQEGAMLALAVISPNRLSEHLRFKGPLTPKDSPQCLLRQDCHNSENGPSKQVLNITQGC